MLDGRHFASLEEVQAAFAAWRPVYNTQRPQKAPGMQTPASRYGVGRRPMPTILAPPEYEPQTPARKVQTGGWISFKDCLIACSRAFTGRHLALRATATDGVLQLCYRRHVLAQVDMRQNSLTSVHHLPEHPFTSSPV